MSDNLAALVRAQAHHQPAHRAIELGDTVLDYEGVWQRISALAGWLDSQNIHQGRRIAVALPETIDHVLLHFAIAAVGAVLIPIDHRAATSEQDRLASAFGARCIVSHCHAERRIALPDSLPETSATALAPGGNADWLVSLSSGSTGEPKGALVTHQQMRHRFITQWRSLKLSGAHRFALATPLCFGAGRSFAMSTLAAGGTLIVLPPPMSPEALAAALDARCATATFLVPTMLRRLPVSADGAPLLPNLRRLIVSGEPLPAEEAQTFRNSISDGLTGYYASSEGGGISVLASRDIATRADSVGRVAHGVEVEIVDDDGHGVLTGSVGLLRYRGPGVSTRTIDAAGNVTDVGPWFYPGDLASCDEAGYLRLAGRRKDVIVRGGINIYPAEIERVIAQSPAVREVAVVGVASAARGEAVHAFVAGDVTEADLQAHCRTHLAPYKQPEAWHQLDALPRTAADKIDKNLLKQHASGQGEAPR
ncbi:MAG: class I adenylate-forming enzyme family protein [Pseudomonadota bacterium]